MKVKFLPSQQVVEAKSGESLLDIALNHGISIQHACGGFCACTTCHCQIVEGAEHLESPEADELERLDVLDGREPNSRLACQSKVIGANAEAITVQIVNHD
jgi:ferredoxin, 2Fe-2S